MFKLKDNKDFWWPVTVAVPVDGRHAKHKFRGQFLLIDQEEIDGYVEDANDDEAGDLDLLSRVLIGWEGVADDDGNPIEFSDEVRDKLLKIPYVRLGLIKAYFEAVAGGRRRKNS